MKAQRADRHAERTTERLRSLAGTTDALLDADATEVRSRIRRMVYGGSRQRNRRTVGAS
jgi:endonuclease III